MQSIMSDGTLRTYATGELLKIRTQCSNNGEKVGVCMVRQGGGTGAGLRCISHCILGVKATVQYMCQCRGSIRGRGSSVVPCLPIAPYPEREPALSSCAGRSWPKHLAVGGGQTWRPVLAPAQIRLAKSLPGSAMPLAQPLVLPLEECLRW